MITKTVGLLRNVINKRNEIVGMIKCILEADNSILITITDSKMYVGGHTEDDSMTLFMLGRAIGQCVEARIAEDPDIDVTDYLMQPNIVATTFLEKKGIL